MEENKYSVKDLCSIFNINANTFPSIAKRLGINSDEYYTQKLSLPDTEGGSYTYIHGKVVADEDFDKAIYKNFKTCSGFAYFRDENEEL